MKRARSKITYEKKKNTARALPRRVTSRQKCRARDLSIFAEKSTTMSPCTRRGGLFVRRLVLRVVARFYFFPSVFTRKRKEITIALLRAWVYGARASVPHKPTWPLVSPSVECHREPRYLCALKTIRTRWRHLSIKNLRRLYPAAAGKNVRCTSWCHETLRRTTLLCNGRIDEKGSSGLERRSGNVRFMKCIRILRGKKK